MNTIGKVKAVNISVEKGTKKKPVEVIETKVDHGIIGDAHAGNWHRQISLLGQESIDKMIEGHLNVLASNCAYALATQLSLSLRVVKL